MANAPLSPPPGVNNLLALALSKIGNYKNYVDSGEPAVTTVTATATILASFPVNGVGQQPVVSRGAYAIAVESVTGTTFQVGPITIEAMDSTVTTAAHIEVVDVIPQFPAITGGVICRDFESSLTIGADNKNGLTNVVALQASVPATGTINAQVKFVAVGTP